MTETNIQLLRLINQNKSLNEIARTLNLSNKQIFQRLNQLKANGYSFTRSYYYNGNIYYKLIKDLVEHNNSTKIITLPEKNSLKIMLISDTHLGSVKENIEALNLIYDYCIQQNINIIINGGDLINGSFGSKNKYNTFEKQIEHLLHDYPFDKNILNFTCLGNHDIDSLRKEGINIASIIQNNRHDLVIIGYNEGVINIKNEYICVRHPVPGLKHSPNDPPLLLKGHSHKTKIEKNTTCTINIPSLSNIFIDEDNILPGAIEMTIIFDKGYYDSIILNHLLINDKIHKVNETILDLHKKDSNAKPSNPKNLLLEKRKGKYI